MSTNLKTLTTSANPDVQVTAFSGGRYRGRMVQLNQTAAEYNTPGRFTKQSVQLDRVQVEALVKQLQEWLES